MNKKVVKYAAIGLMIIMFSALAFAAFTACSAKKSETTTSPTTITAQAASTDCFNFEEIDVSIDNAVGYVYKAVYREKSTDVLYFSFDKGLTTMLNPETGKPLTYSDWKANYAK